MKTPFYRLLAVVMAALMAGAPVPAMAAVTGTIQLVPNIDETATVDGGTSTFSYRGSGSAAQFNWTKTITSGTGLDQANKVFYDQVTLAGSGTQPYDLDSTLTGALGTVTFSRIYGIAIKRSDTPTASTQDENVGVRGDFILTKYLFANGDTLANVQIPIRPGGIWYWVAPDSTGVAVTATTGDVLELVNNSSADSCTLQVLILGS